MMRNVGLLQLWLADLVCALPAPKRTRTAARQDGLSDEPHKSLQEVAVEKHVLEGQRTWSSTKAYPVTLSCAPWMEAGDWENA